MWASAFPVKRLCYPYTVIIKCQENLKMGNIITFFKAELLEKEACWLNPNDVVELLGRVQILPAK